MRLSDIGEVKTIEFIKRITRNNISNSVKVGIGDDACVLKDGTIVSTDAYIENIHFSLEYFTLYEVGQRVTCGTLSDIAAMAGNPTALFISALLPSKMKQQQLQELYKGIISITDRFNCAIAGGDIVAYPELGLILTALGKTNNAKLRSSARPGDYLYMTGYCGLAETGRLALKDKLSRTKYTQSIKRHTCPIPRISEAQKLKKYINALIDTSDGLSTDAFHLSEKSKVKIKIFANKIPVHNETERIANVQHRTTDTKFSLALNGGEDYELLFTSKHKNLPLEKMRTKVTQIGIVEKGRGVYLVEDNKEIPLLPKGYDHFKR